MTRHGKEIEDLAEATLTRLSQNSDLIVREYEHFLSEMQKRVDQVR